MLVNKGDVLLRTRDNRPHRVLLADEESFFAVKMYYDAKNATWETDYAGLAYDNKNKTLEEQGFEKVQHPCFREEKVA